MSHTLESRYVVNESLDHEKMKTRVSSKLLYTSPILEKIQNAVGEILEVEIPVQLSDYTISKLQKQGYNAPGRYSANLNTHITFILRELWENALDACEKKGLLAKEQEITAKIQYSERTGIISIIMRDNGIGSADYKIKGNKSLYGGKGVFELYLKDFNFVRKHRKVLSQSGSVIQVQIILPKFKV